MRYRAAARGDAPGVMLLDGVHLLAEAVAAGTRVQHVAVKSTAMDITEVGALLERLSHGGCDVDAVSPGVMDALSPVRSSSTVVALAARPRPADAALFGVDSALVIVAVDVQDPGNLGAIVRVAEAAGATAAVAAGASADPFGWKALRGSMGSALRLPIGAWKDTVAMLDAARRHGCRVFATVPGDGRPMFDVDYTGRCAILIGGEGPGLPASAIRGADDRITIPMQAPVESLNAAVTAALVAYEARRQRHDAVRRTK